MTRKIVATALTVTAVWTALAGHAQAQATDIVIKNNKEEVAGTVLSVSATAVEVKAVPKSKKVPANEIAMVRWKATAALNVAVGFERSDKLDKALEAYKKFAKSSGGASTNVKSDVEFLTARVTLKLAGTDASKLADAISGLDKFVKDHPQSYRFYEAIELLGQAQIGAQDYAAAKTTLAKLAAAPWNDLKMAAKNAEARLLLAQDNIGGARAAFDAVAAMDAKTPNERARKYDAMLGSANCLLEDKKYKEAADVLEQVTAEADPEDRRVQAEAYLRLGDSRRNLNETKKAALAYLHVDIMFASQRRQHAESLYRLAEVWQVLGDPRRHAEARETLDSEYPQSEWTKKLSQSGAGS